MNGQIIRYLALNGPSLIYSVAKDLASRSQTKVHYPTVNRRVHELVERKYVQKAGTRTTKAGVAADLYASTVRADFAALAGIPDEDDAVELSPKEIRQMIANASLREGSPFVLIMHIIEEGQSAAEHVDRELLPEIIKAIRNGYLNLDAADEGVICSAFASIISRKITAKMDIQSRDQLSKKEQRDLIDILMRSLEKTIAPSDLSRPDEVKLTPISRQWVNELKVFLRLHSVGSD